ncbi:MAG: hypothetical protein HWQ41_30580 [Nostoc sp. NOS(2021)]|uniref:hypothetical protein n=1 Tax=Nostoc sp. NOS(2021) TaxID=2815407 RepID=UPI0025EC480D|nr:hypothetical protein [Nostoc sp. NOS(2021)]MBN3899456.1 hypothetical protein [Nostoc sp. NOS(2021)]
MSANTVSATMLGSSWSLASGRLKTLLEDYSLPTQQLNLLYPSSKQLSRLVSTYIDFCTEWVDCL